MPSTQQDGATSLCLLTTSHVMRMGQDLALGSSSSSRGMDPDAEQALLQLQAEELAVGYAQSCAACAPKVGRQEWLRVVPGACASLKLTHVVIVGACVKVSNNINTGSYGDSAIHKG